MASLIKNQIIKHLSTFARNLKPEQISLEVLRGKGQLRNLELNEEVISERLEFPPWLKIVKAHCTSVTVKIPWTQIKSAPVQLFVEEIRVIIRLVTPTVPNNTKKPTTHNKAYDLPERVLECLSLYVQSIEVYFETESGSKINFGGSIMLSHLVLESRMPNWSEWPTGQVPKINMTRIHERTLGQVLFFKHVSWRVLKIEASHNTTEINEQQTKRGSALNSPLRLLTENGRCRITIKKNTLDCSLISGRIELLFDEIHWLAYMAHLRSAIDFYQHIMDLATLTSNILPKQLNVQQFVDQQKNLNNSTSLSSSSSSNISSNNSAFCKLDITQSSHHLLISRIDLHLCDDSSIGDLPPDWNIDSGAMQATIHKLKVDFYPQHQVFSNDGKQLKCSSRSNWLRYLAPNTFTDLINKQLDHHFGLINSKMDSNTRLRFERIWPQLVSTNVVIRIEDLIIHAISERKTKKDDIKYLLSVNKELKEKMPQPLSFAHLEITNYCFPATDNFPVPPNSLHLMIAPFNLIPDIKSVRWLIYAFENILNSFEIPQPSKNVPSKQVEIRIEVIMPKIILDPTNLTSTKNKEVETEKNFSSSSTTTRNKETTKQITKKENSFLFPKRFFIHLTTILFSNYTLISDTDINIQIKFPQILKSKTQRESTLNFLKFVEGQCSLNKNCENYLILQTILERIEKETTKNLICENNQEEWYFSIPTLWVDCDFGPNTWELPLINDLNLFGVINSVNDKEGRIKGNCVQIEPLTNVEIILDHFQFVQLEQLGDRITDLIDQINSDRQFFTKNICSQNDLPISIFLHCNKINLHLILPLGLTPSPYDINYNFDLFTPLDIYTSSSETSSHAINEENAQQQLNKLTFPKMSTKSNSLTNIDSSFDKQQNLLLSNNFQQTPKQQQFPNSARASLTTTTTAENGSGNGKNTFKTVSSLPRVCDVLNDGRLSGSEIQSIRRQKLLTLIGQTSSSPSSDFFAGDLESNFDETLSITSLSTEQIAFDSALNDRESELSSEGIEEAGEAIEEEEEEEENILKNQQQVNKLRILRHKEILFGRDVNVCKVLIEDFNFYINSNNGRSKAFGFATSVNFIERLRVSCGKIYNEKEENSSANIIEELTSKIEELKNSLINPMDNAKLVIELNSSNNQSKIKLNINGVNIQLNKEIISQLGPFFESQEEIEENSKALFELILEKCNIEIKDSTKRFPILIRLGEVFIEKGNSSMEEENVFNKCG